MKWRSQLAGLGVATLLASCSGNADQNKVQSSAAQSLPNPPAVPVVAKPQSFPSPTLSPTAIVEVPSIPGLLRPTNAGVRTQSVGAGRPDPFASLTMTPLTIPIASIKAKNPATTSAAANNKLPIIPLPLPLPQSKAPTTTALPPVSVPVSPAPSPTAMADAIEVTGVLQLKGKWVIIVKEPYSVTSRYVSAGDYLANGTVLVKKILAGGSDPVIVFQQSGVEVTKTIGATKGPIANRL